MNSQPNTRATELTMQNYLVPIIPDLDNPKSKYPINNQPNESYHLHTYLDIRKHTIPKRRRR